MKIGVLSLQGNYSAHALHLQRCGVEVKLVTLPRHLDAIQGLVIPGGESTALLKLMAPHHFLDHIRQFIQQGGGLLATCAGMIIAAKKVVPTQNSLQVIDIDVERNAYGRQLDSHIIQGTLKAPFFKDADCEMIFIRAPRISRIGPTVTVLATVADQVVMVQQERIIALAFHPELTSDLRIHQYFLSQCSR